MGTITTHEEVVALRAMLKELKVEIDQINNCLLSGANENILQLCQTLVTKSSTHYLNHVGLEAVRLKRKEEICIDEEVEEY